MFKLEKYNQNIESCVSVLISTYNPDTHLLKKSLQSVELQDISCEYVLVLDGANKSETESIIEWLSKRKSIVIEKENTGLTDSLNIGLSFCTGEFIARIDDDDEWLPGKLAAQLSIMMDSDYDICGTGYRVFSKSGNLLWEKNISLNDDCLKKFLRNENPFCHSSVVFRKSKVDLIAGYNSNYKTGQDYNLWVRLLVDSRGIVIPDVYVHRTNSLGSVSMMKRKEQKFNACKSRLLAIKEFGGDFRSIFNLFMSLIKLMVPNSLIRVIKRHDTYN